MAYKSYISLKLRRLLLKPLPYSNIIRMLTSSLVVCGRCLMAAARSCLTSTRPLTRYTDRRDWLLPLTDTLWSPTPGTTALRSTATCSSGSPPPLSTQTVHPEGSHTLTCTLGCRTNPGRFCTRPSSRFSSRRRAICLTHLHSSVCCITSERWTESEAELWFLWTVRCPCSNILTICFGGVSRSVPNPLQRRLVCDTKTLCSYLLLNLKMLAVLLLVARFWRCGM